MLLYCQMWCEPISLSWVELSWVTQLEWMIFVRFVDEIWRQNFQPSPPPKQVAQPKKTFSQQALLAERSISSTKQLHIHLLNKRKTDLEIHFDWPIYQLVNDKKIYSLNQLCLRKLPMFGEEIKKIIVWMIFAFYGWGCNSVPSLVSLKYSDILICEFWIC